MHTLEGNTLATVFFSILETFSCLGSKYISFQTPNAIYFATVQNQIEPPHLAALTDVTRFSTSNWQAKQAIITV